VIICCEKSSYMREYIQDCAEYNGISNKITLVDEDWLWSRSPLPSIEAVVGEPHYTTAVLPWHNLLFWFSISSLSLPPSTTITPSTARMYLLPMHYKDLWKIRAPLGIIEGFKMTHFDQIIEKASDKCDNEVEPQPLWEYPGEALALPTQVFQFDLKEPFTKTNLTFTDTVTLESQLPINGVAIWMEWQLDSDHCVRRTNHTGCCGTQGGVGQRQ